MKVLFIRSNPVMPDSRVEKEVRALITHGHEVSVLAWDRKENYQLRIEPLNNDLKEVSTYRKGIKAEYGSGMKNLIQFIKWQLTIRSFLRHNHFEAIHACDFDTAFISFHSINHHRTKFIYDIFDYYVDSFSLPCFLKGIVTYLDRTIISKSDLVILCTEQRYKQIQITPKRSIVIHNSPPQYSSIASSINSSHKRIRIGYFGILAPGRLIEELVKIVAMDVRFELHIGGFGPLATFVTKASEQYDNIIFYGITPYKKVIEKELECDILTAIYDPGIRNHYYAAPNKFYESLMLGKPLIMCKKTGMSDIVSKNQIGVLIDYSLSGLKAGLEELLKIQNKWNEISLRMTSIYEQYFSWEIMEKRLVSAYRSL